MFRRQNPTPPESGLSVPLVKFEYWKSALREDCDRQGKLIAFEAMGDLALRLFWERGVAANVAAILEDGSSPAPAKHSQDGRSKR